MQVPVQVTFRDMPVSDAVEAACWEEAARLERYYDRVTSCRVVIAESRHRAGVFEVRIDLAVPGRLLVVTDQPPEDHADSDVFAAVREAFARARRQLEDYARKRRHGPTQPGRKPQ